MHMSLTLIVSPFLLQVLFVEEQKVVWIFLIWFSVYIFTNCSHVQLGIAPLHILCTYEWKSEKICHQSRSKEFVSDWTRGEEENEKDFLISSERNLQRKSLSTFFYEKELTADTTTALQYLKNCIIFAF